MSLATLLLLFIGQIEDPSYFERTYYHGKVAVSQLDNGRVVTATRRSDLEFFSPEKGRLQSLRCKPDFYTRAVALSGDGRLLAASSYGEEKLLLWDTATGKLNTSVKIKDPLFPVSLSANGKLVAVGTLNGTELWSVAEQKRLRVWQGCRSLAFSPNGDWLAMGQGKATCTIRKISDGSVRFRQQFSPNKEFPPIEAVATSADSRLAAFGFRRCEIALVDAHKGQHIRTFEWDCHVASLAFSPDGAMLASGTDTIVALWEVSSGKKVMEIENAHKDVISSMVFGKSGDRLFTGGWDQKVFCWDVKTGKQLW